MTGIFSLKQSDRKPRNTLSPVSYLKSRNPQTAVFYDTFTDANGTSLLVHTPDIDTVGAGWLRVGAQVWTINGNKVGHVQSFGNAGEAYANCGVADGAITCDVTVSTSGGVDLAGVAFRLTDTNNLWKVVVARATGAFVIFERNAGVDINRTQKLVPIVGGATYTIKVILSGQSIVATLDGADQIPYALASFNQAVTNHGIESKSDDIFDDFKVVA